MIDDSIRLMQETPRQEGASVQAMPPTTAGVAVSTIGTQTRPETNDHRIASRMLTTQGPAHTETGNVYHQTPQAEMELVAWMESAMVVGGSGSIVIDPNVCNAWRISLDGDATISLAPPTALPPEQISAGRDRDRATGVALLIAKNNHALGFAAGILFGVGSAALVQADSNFDVFVFDWWGGPTAGTLWHGKVIDSGLAAWGA